MSEGGMSWICTYDQHISAATNSYSMSTDAVYLALSNKANSIDIYASNDDDNSLQLELKLEGHRSVPNCLTFSHSTEPVLLLSSARDYLIQWNVTECLINHHNGVAVKGNVILQSPTDGINHISYSYNQHTIAICTGCSVIIADGGTHHELCAHNDVVTCAEFCPHYDSTLVSASVDRTYMIWNVASAQLLYRSSIISSSPFDRLLMVPDREEFILASRNGMIRFYDISSDSDFSQQMCIDTEKVLSSIEAVGDGESTSYSSSVLALQVLSLPLNPVDGENPTPDTHEMRSLFSSIHLLLLLTSSHLLIFNTRTGDLLSALSLSDRGMNCISSACIQRCDITDDEGSGHVLKCVSKDLIGGQLRMSIIDVLKGYLSSRVIVESTMSTIAVVPVNTNSPLRSSLLPKAPSTAKVAASRSKPRKADGVKDQPVVYRSKVRSSGYATSHPKRRMFQPKTAGKQPTPKASSNSAAKPVKVYPSNATPITKLKGEVITADTRPTQIMGMHFSADGQNLALACANKQMYSFRLPLNDKKFSAYSGHAGPVHSVKWSFLAQNLVTAGGSTVNVWSKEEENAVLVIDKLHGNITDSSGDQLGQALPGAATHARFYYLDKFILISSAQSLLLYKYYIDSSKNDLKRYENGSRYKLAARLNIVSAQSIVSLSAINSFYSYLVIAAGSDRSIQVFDMNQSMQSRIVEDGHTKPAHHLVQSEGSTYSSLPTSAYDLFITSAVGDGVKLWDLRTQSCVRKFESHTSKAFSCTCDFSPDGRYIAAGSEDRHVYIYDIGSGKVVSRVKGMSDVCTNVLYHPLRAQLGVGSLQGSVAMYEC